MRLVPEAQDDSYSATVDTTLNVAPPGVLVNDTAGIGTNLTAVLVNGPANGTLNLNADGSFSYTPAAGFVGTDSFTYQANDGVTNSSTATVTLSVWPVGTLFADDFTRPTDPGTLSPWVAQSGKWTVTGGLLEGGPNALNSYGFVYLARQLDQLFGAGTNAIPGRGVWRGGGWALESDNRGALRGLDLPGGLAGRLQCLEADEVPDLDELWLQRLEFGANATGESGRRGHRLAYVEAVHGGESNRRLL